MYIEVYQSVASNGEEQEKTFILYSFKKIHVYNSSDTFFQWIIIVHICEDNAETLQHATKIVEFFWKPK